MNYSYILLGNIDKDDDITAFRLGSVENNEWIKNFFDTNSLKYDSSYWMYMQDAMELDIKIDYDSGTHIIHNKVIPKGKVLIISFDSENLDDGVIRDVSLIADFLGLEDYEF